MRLASVSQVSLPSLTIAATNLENLVMQTFYISFRHIVSGAIYVLPICASSIQEAYKKALDYPYENNWYELIREDVCKN